MNRSKKSLIGSAILAILALGSLIAFVLFKRSSSGSNQQASSQSSQPQPNSQPQAAETIIRDIVLSAGYNQIVANSLVDVSRMETAGWTSSLFKTRNNLFGMKQPQKRKTTSIAEKSETWAKYSSVTDSARDIVYYLDEFNYPQNVESLSDFIAIMKEKNYFGAERFETYYNKVVAWKDRS